MVKTIPVFATQSGSDARQQHTHTHQCFNLSIAWIIVVAVKVRFWNNFCRHCYTLLSYSSYDSKSSSKSSSNATGVCKISARSESTRYDYQTPFPQGSTLTRWKVGVDRRAIYIYIYIHTYYVILLLLLIIMIILIMIMMLIIILVILSMLK